MPVNRKKIFFIKPAPIRDDIYNREVLHMPSEGPDTRILKLLYLLHSGLNPRQMGFDAEALKAIPMLTKHRILRREGNKPVMNIPVMCPQNLPWLQDLCLETIKRLFDFVDSIPAPYKETKLETGNNICHCIYEKRRASRLSF